MLPADACKLLRKSSQQARQQQQQQLRAQEEEAERKKDLQPLKSMVDKQLRKTRFCYFYRKGMCKYGSKCTFAHQEQELLSAPDLRKTRVCKAFLAGGCNDDTCNFAHGSEELRATDIFFKTHLCLWHARGRCVNGVRCRFAHGLEELRGGAGREQQRPAAARMDDFSSASSSQEQDSSQAGSSGDAPSSGGGQQEFCDRRGNNMAQVASEISSAIASKAFVKTLAEALASAGRPLPEARRPGKDAAETFASADSPPMKVQLAPQQMPALGFGAAQDGGAPPMEVASKILGLDRGDGYGAITLDSFALTNHQWPQGLAGRHTSPDAFPQQGPGARRQHFAQQDPVDFVDPLATAMGTIGQLQSGPQEAYAHMIYALSNLSLQIQNLEQRMQAVAPGDNAALTQVREAAPDQVLLSTDWYQ